MLSTRSVKTVTVMAIFSALGVAGAAQAGPREQQLRKELLLAEQELIQVVGEIEAVEREIVVTVDAINIYKQRYEGSGDVAYLELIASATAKVAVLTTELADLEIRSRELQQLIKVLRRLLENVTVSISGRAGTTNPIGT